MTQKLLESTSSFGERPSSFFFRHPSLRILVFECIGTAILAIGICCTTYKNPVKDQISNTVMMHDLYISLSLYMSICFFAPLTGGHFNPAVTIGLFMNKKSKKMKLKTLLMYFIGQFLGSTCGCIFSKLYYNVGDGPFDSQTEYSVNDIIVRASGQMIGTLFFVLFILIVTTQQTTFIHEQCWVHLFIPICLYGGRKLSKYIRCLNPAILFVLQWVTFFSQTNSKLDHVWFVFIICASEIIGAVIGATFFNYLFSKRLQTWRNQQ